MTDENMSEIEAEDMPILAICYDFDKTLSPDDMQAQGFIQSTYGDDPDSVRNFWDESNKLAKDNDMDQNLAWMYKMTQYARGKEIFNRQTLEEYGSKVQLFKGVETWFERIDEYGKNHGVEVEHYIISSGLKEMIAGTAIAKKFKQIYASSFFYDKDGIAVWPARAINYTDKTQYLFRIEKGVLDSDSQEVNNYYKPDEMRVPFRNIVYIGDSATDIPCMKLVTVNGGHAIGVYNPETNDKTKVYRMLEENRIKYFTEADYTKNSNLEKLVKRIIDRTRANEIVEKMHYSAVAEVDEIRLKQTEHERDKEKLIDRLEESDSFRNTRNVVKDLITIHDWTYEEATELLKIAVTNTQVKWVLHSDDVKEFYTRLIEDHKDRIDDDGLIAEVKKLMSMSLDEKIAETNAA